MSNQTTNTRKKVLIVVECFEKGVGKHVIELYNSFKDKFDIYIIYGKSRYDINLIRQIDKEKLFELSSLKRNIGINDIVASFQIRKIIKKIKPDIIHCHSSKAGLAGRLATIGVKNLKVLYSPHGYMFLNYDEKSFKKRVFVLAERFLSHFYTNYTITTSLGEDKAFLSNNIDNANKRILVEHGIDNITIDKDEQNEIKRKYNISNKDIVIGTMARFEVQKDPVGTYNILNELSKEPGVKCVFWGNGSLYEQIKKMHDDDNSKVILAGQVTNPDLYLSIVDIYLTASLYEGLPYTLIECLALGLPIVASDTVGNNDCVFENKNGKLFEVKNYSQAINKIKDLIQEKNLDKYKRESLKIYTERFSKEKMQEKYIDLYMR